MILSTGRLRQTRFMLAFLFGTASLAALPIADHALYFEQRSSALFKSRTGNCKIEIGLNRFTIDGVTLRFTNAGKTARFEGVGSPVPATYLTRSSAQTFAQYAGLRVRNLYPGVDVHYYGTPDHMEYDLELAQSVAANSFGLRVEGARHTRLDEAGNLIMQTDSGELRQLRPHVFEVHGSARREIRARYILRGDNITFDIAAHDRHARVTIDPVVVYQKYYGGSGTDQGGPITTDSHGNVYVAGSTNSIDFPSLNGSTAHPTPPLLAFSNAGASVSSFAVGEQTSVTTLAGTASGNVIYAATPNGIFVSRNHGVDFTAAMPLPKPGIVQGISVDQIDPAHVWVATSQGLFTTDSGGSLGWGEADTGLAVSGTGLVNAASVLVSPVNHQLVLATTLYPNSLYRTTNAGVNWQQLNPSFPGEPTPQQFSGTNITMALSPDGGTLYVIDGNGSLESSTDSGNTWKQLAGQLFGAKSIAVDAANPATLYVVDNLGLQVSTNSGATFNTISPKLPGGEIVTTFAKDSSGALYLSTTAGNLQVSPDNGNTWTPLPRRPNVHQLVTLGGQVFAAADAPSIPFIAKWSADGSQLLYSTFFGGSFSDSINGIAVNAQGEAIVAGVTTSPDFPATRTLGPAASPNSTSGFIAKLSADGSQLIYSTLLRASKSVAVNALALDAAGAPYITGTAPPDFPTTSAVFQSNVPAAACQRPGPSPFAPTGGNLGTHAFVTKLRADGSGLAYSTFLTGACGSIGRSIAVDAAGDVVVAGVTPSPDFPVTANAYQSVFPGGPAATINYPNPVDFGFITKLSPAGDRLLASTLVGGGFETAAAALTLDATGNTYVTGTTWGITPGATPGAYKNAITYSCPNFSIGPSGPPHGGSDAFLLKLDPTLSAAAYLTYLGGPCDDNAVSIQLAPNGNVWLAGAPSSSFPLVAPYALEGAEPYFVSEFNPDATKLLFSTYSQGAQLAIDTAGAVYVSGSGQSLKGPQKNQPSLSAASLLKIDPSQAPPVIINSVAASTTYQTAASAGEPQPYLIAPGELIDITGQHLGPAATVFAQLDATGRLPYILNATTVSFNGYYSPVLSVQDGLIVCVTPFEISGITEVTVNVNGQKSGAVRVAVIPSAPFILSVVNQDGSINGPAHPASQGSVVTLYVSGLGITAPLSQDGDVNTVPLPVPVASVLTAVNGTAVTPQFVGAARGAVAGITQVNVPVPSASYPASGASIRVNSASATLYVIQ